MARPTRAEATRDEVMRFLLSLMRGEYEKDTPLIKERLRCAELLLRLDEPETAPSGKMMRVIVVDAPEGE